MPYGKPAGQRCVQLSSDNRCLLFGLPERPAFCVGLKPAADMCATNREEAIIWLTELEQATQPTAG